jgi:uncharacterized RDD family membrane protein YckC
MQCAACGLPLAAADTRCPACGQLPGSTDRRPAPPVDAGPRVVRYLVAGFWRRLLAFALDLVLLLPLLTGFGLLAVRLAGLPLPRSAQFGPDLALELLLSGNLAALATLGLSALLGFIYFFIFQATSGQTLGKRLLGLRVLASSGALPGPWRAILRTLGYCASGLLLLLGFVWIGFDREKRGLHDFIAGTYVIRS